MQALTPLLTGITLSIIAAVCARYPHQSTGATDVFMISPAVGYLMAGCGLLFCVVPLLPGAAGGIPRTRFFLYFCPFWGGAFAAAIYFFRYRVVVADQFLTFGAFIRRTIPFSNVIDRDIIRGSRGGELWVYLQGGERLKFSSMLGDFDELVGLIDSHLAIVPNGNPDSPGKIADRARRSLENKRVGMLLVAGMMVVGIVVIVLWKLRLTR